MIGMSLLWLVGILAIGIPVGASLVMLGLVLAGIYSPFPLVKAIGETSWGASSDVIVVSVPMFILMGELMLRSGVAERMYDAMTKWLAWLPGGLMHSNIGACAMFAATSGSSAATAATIGTVALPEMKKHGYSVSLYTGSLAAGGTLGILIPPSIPMILYGVITETSIGALFIAGIVPGLLMAVLLSLTVMYQVWRDPSIAPRASADLELTERWTSLRSVVPVMLLAFAVLGSIYTGIATPSEAGAVGALGSLIIAAVLGALTLPAMTRILNNTVRTTAMFVLLLIGGLFSAFVLARLGIPQATAKMLVEMNVPPWVIMVLINVLLTILGMFMDPMSLLVIIVPVFFPAVVALGYDPVWFGVIITINIEIASISPPVGFNLFVLKSVLPSSRMQDIIQGSLIFIIPLAAGIGMLIAWPEIALWLPRLMAN